MNVNPNDYNREERRNSSWWSSRHRSGSGSVETLRRIRRLTLIDMVLLLVIIGVLVPWMVQRDNTSVLGPYRVRIDERNRSKQVTLILKVRLPSGAEAADNDIVGWRINDQNGSLLQEEYDLAPKQGESREFLFSSLANQVLSIEILAGNEALEIEMPGE